MINELIKKTIEWLMSVRFLSSLRKVMIRAITYAILFKNGVFYTTMIRKDLKLSILQKE